MGTSERRQAPRMAVNGLAYVNLDPDNGGIILNISEGGLCFQSTAPVRRTDTIRFWFSYRNRRNDSSGAWKDEPQNRGVSRFIEASSELAWIDESKKVGGLRFTRLPVGAREEIREWMRQPTLVNVNGQAIQRFPSATRPSPGSAALAEVSAKLQRLSRQIQSIKLPDGFSGGLATGVIFSAVIVATFVLVSHSRQLGDTLVRLGERLGGRSWSEQKPPETPSGAIQAFADLSVAPSVVPVPVPKPEPEKEKPQFAAATILPSPVVKQLSTSKPSNVAPHPSEPVSTSAAPPASALKASASPRVTSTATRPSLPEKVAAPVPDPGAIIPRVSAPNMEFAGKPALRIVPSKVDSSGMPSEKFLEVGKFKEKLLADKATDQLTQKGFPAAVVQKTRFLSKSFQVLVGPYGTDTEAEAVHKNLASLGFTPRSYERGKRDLNMPPGMKVGSNHLPDGFCVISWESYIPDAIVKVEDDNGRGVSVEGKWVRQGAKFTQNAIAYQRNRDGSRTLLEIRFAGMNQALVFGTLSN
jgi:hypothetical protein